MHNCDTHFAADATHEHYSSYYANPNVKAILKYLLPGLRSLLRFQASNGLGERIFGKLGRLLTKNSKMLDVESKLSLNVNTQYRELGLGYPKVKGAWTPEAEDYEVFSSFVVDVP